MPLQYKIGHRGRPGIPPRYAENTLLSLREALTLGANALEFDVRFSKDKVVVAVHDETMERTTQGHATGLVSSYTFEELQAMDVGFGEPVPSLALILTTCAPAALLNIELKETGMSEAVHHLIETHAPDARVVVSAFDARDDSAGTDGTVTWDDLRYFSERGIPTALLAGDEKIAAMGYGTFIQTARDRNAVAIHPPYQAVTKELVDLAHEAGLMIQVWTVNDPLQLATLVSYGVDGIFCDVVECLKGL